LPVSHSPRTLSHLADDGNRQEDARKHAGDGSVAASSMAVYFNRRFPQPAHVTDLELPRRFDWVRRG
jgi:hypothetical protein